MNEDAYTVDYIMEAIKSQLSTLLVDGASIKAFAPLTYYYDGREYVSLIIKIDVSETNSSEDILTLIGFPLEIFTSYVDDNVKVKFRAISALTDDTIYVAPKQFSDGTMLMSTLTPKAKEAYFYWVGRIFLGIGKEPSEETKETTETRTYH